MNTISVIVAIMIFTITIIVIVAKTGWRPSRPNIHLGWIVGALGLAFVAWVVVYWVSRPETKQTASTPTPMSKPVVEFPLSGESHATKEIGVKAWLDPQKTYTRPSRPARYVFVKDPEIFFDDTEGARVDTTERHKTWLDMPAGEYLIYPLKGDKVYFRWWQ